MNSPPQLSEPCAPPAMDLLTAAATGNIKVVRNILIANPMACKETFDAGGKTALHKAARHGQADVITLLLQNGADVNILTTRRHRSALYDACSKGYFLVVNLLIEAGADLNAREFRGRTALYSAALRNHADITAKLLDEGANYLLADNGNRGPHFAAAAVGCDCALDVLLNHPRLAEGEVRSLVASIDTSGRTALHYACLEGAVSTARLLLHHGAKCDSEAVLANQGFNTALYPLHSACYHGSEEMVSLLLNEGKADANKQDRNQCTALHMACRRGHRGVAALLLAKGASPSTRNSRGRPPMLEAAIAGDAGSMCDLLDYSPRDAPVSTSPSPARSSPVVDINMCDSDGRSALHMSCYNGHDEVVHALLARQCRVTVQDADGQTPLHMAALGGGGGLIALLIDRGVDSTLKDSNDHTAVDVAKTPALKELILKVKVEVLPDNVSDITWYSSICDDVS
jgi:ankyrin repeat protein